MKLNIGCTLARHKQIGINAVVNARAGRQDLNDLTIEDIELRRDAQKIRQYREERVIIHQFNSKAVRRNLHRTRFVFDADDRCYRIERTHFDAIRENITNPVTKALFDASERLA